MLKKPFHVNMLGKDKFNMFCSLRMGLQFEESRREVG